MEEAEELPVGLMERRKRLLGEEYPDTLTSMNNLAITLKSQSRNEEAISLMRRCFRIQNMSLAQGVQASEGRMCPAAYGVPVH